MLFYRFIIFNFNKYDEILEIRDKSKCDGIKRLERAQR